MLTLNSLDFRSLADTSIVLAGGGMECHAIGAESVGKAEPTL